MSRCSGHATGESPHQASGWRSVSPGRAKPRDRRVSGGAAAWDAEIPWILASAHAAGGAKDEALFWLDTAIARGMINYPLLSEHDRFLDNVRGDARFDRLMERARREGEQFQV